MYIQQLCNFVVQLIHTLLPGFDPRATYFIKSSFKVRSCVRYNYYWEFPTKPPDPLKMHQDPRTYIVLLEIEFEKRRKDKNDINTFSSIRTFLPDTTVEKWRIFFKFLNLVHRSKIRIRNPYAQNKIAVKLLYNGKLWSETCIHLLNLIGGGSLVRNHHCCCKTFGPYSMHIYINPPLTQLVPSLPLPKVDILQSLPPSSSVSITELS